MKQESIDRLISATTTVLLATIGVVAYYLGAIELGAALVGGSLGHAMPSRKVAS